MFRRPLQRNWDSASAIDEFVSIKLLDIEDTPDMYRTEKGEALIYRDDT